MGSRVGSFFAFNRDVSGNWELYTPIYYALLVNSINLRFDKLLTNTVYYILTKSNFKSATNTILYFMNITYGYLYYTKLILQCPYFTNTILINKCVTGTTLKIIKIMHSKVNRGNSVVFF